MKHTDLRFNINRQTEFQVFKDMVQIYFENGRWLTVKTDDDETPNEVIQRLKERMGSQGHMSLWIELDLIDYDTSGRCQIMRHNIEHQEVSFEDAVETWHDPGPVSYSKDKN